MATIRRLTDSCLLVTDDTGTTLFDPGFHTFESGEIDLDTIGEVQRVLITHTHGDHVNPPFVRWLVDRGDDVTVYSNDAVAEFLAPHDIEVTTTVPDGVTAEDVLHEKIPNGDQPPNRCWTIDGLLSHPGDSYQLSATAPVMALPLMCPWGSVTASVAFAKRLTPDLAIPIHDFYLTAQGRGFVHRFAGHGLAGSGIELLDLGWGDSITV
jgi:hypothetical protein